MKLLKKLAVSTVVAVVVGVAGWFLRILLYPHGKHHRR